MDLNSQPEMQHVSDEQIWQLMHKPRFTPVSSSPSEEMLEMDEQGCSRLLFQEEPLDLEQHWHSPCRALVEAMKLNSEVSKLKEFRGGWMHLEAAASINSLESLTLILSTDIDAPGDVPDRLFAALETGKSHIWDLGIDFDPWIMMTYRISVPRRDIWDLPIHQDRDRWRKTLAQLCRAEYLKSLRLSHPALTNVLLEVLAAEEFHSLQFPEHLSLVIDRSRPASLFKALMRANPISLQITLLDRVYPRDVLSCISHGIQHFSLHKLTVESLSDVVHADEFLPLLRGSRLRRFFIFEPVIMLPDRKDQLRFVDYLDKNFDCPLEMIEGVRWADTSIEQTCKEILERNRMYREGGLSQAYQMPPTTAKLFICGDSSVGKSTLRKNLTRRVCIPGCMQFARSTYGIRMDTLRFGEQSLVVCDLAGQPEFHALHHYFMRGSDKDLFLIVCKTPGVEDDPTMLDNQLKYWLRFIVAHRSLSEQKPRVLILLNYFPGSETRQVPDLRCQAVIQDYQDVIDFGPNPPYVSGLNVKSYRSVQGLKPKLHEALASLIGSRPYVPKVCKDVLQRIHSARRPRVMSIQEFMILCGMKEGKPLAKACITYLHDTGEVLYLEEEDDETKQFIVMDVQWFLQELVGQFLPRLGRPDGGGAKVGAHAHQPLPSIKATIGTMCTKVEHVDYLLSCLDRMGVTMQHADKVTILPLMQEKLGRWRNDLQDLSYSFWGRRFDCKDSERRLLPSGIFNMLQVRLADMKFSVTNIGKGWLYLVENRIHIIVKIGGTRGEWYDKHWVDVLVRIPFEDDDPSSYLLETGDRLFRQVKTCLFQLCGGANWGCPSVELEEKVIGPKSVEQDPSAEFRNVAKLDQVLVRVEEEGMLYSYTWPTGVESSRVFQLLFPGERDAYFHKQRSALVEVDTHVEECLKPTREELMAEARSDDSFQLTDSVRHIVQESESRIVMQVKASEKNIINEIQRLELVVRKQMESVRHQGLKIMNKLEFHLEFEAPKYPFMTDNNKSLEKISALAFGTTSRLHFLCEDSQGCHPLENQKGISIKATPEWFKKAAPVLIPALRILVFGLKIVAAAGLGMAIPATAYPAGVTDKTIDTVCEEVFGIADRRLKSTVPSEDDLKNFHGSLSEFLKGKNMGEEFGLHQTMENGRRVWLCQKHYHQP